MPDVSDYDNQEDWMAACVPTRIDEGDEQDQAVAVCLDIWRDRNKKMSNALKTLSRNDSELRVGNYIVLYGGKDLEGVGSANVNGDGSTGEYFSPRTRFESQYTKAGFLYIDWEHAQGEAGDEVLGVVDWKTAKVDDRGVFVERVLNRRNRYVQWIDELGWFDDGTLGTSSQAVTDMTEKAANGEILMWPLERDTLTVSPMEPRMLTENQVVALKGLGLNIPEPHKAEPEADPSAVSVVKAGIEIEMFLIDTLQEV
jgi:hypothetical protein